VINDDDISRKQVQIRQNKAEDFFLDRTSSMKFTYQIGGRDFLARFFDSTTSLRRFLYEEGKEIRNLINRGIN